MSNNALQKNFQSNSKGLTAAPTLHESYTASATRVFNDTEGYPRCFFVNTVGLLVIKDAAGISASYNVLASQPFIFENCTEIESGTTCDLIIQW